MKVHYFYEPSGRATMFLVKALCEIAGYSFTETYFDYFDTTAEALAAYYRIHTLPTLLIFDDNGQEALRMSGRIDMYTLKFALGVKGNEQP